MPGPVPKAPERRQRRNHRTLVPFTSKKIEKTPAAPKEFLAATQEAWNRFWKSQVGRVLDVEIDLPAVTRLHSLMDERERAYRAYRRKRMIRGSTGQPVVNPMIRVVHDCDKEIRQMEDRLGKTIRSRAQIGFVMGEAAKSLADLNRMLNGDESENDEGIEDDPRRKQA